MSDRPLTLSDRVLRPFADVKGGEGKPALLLLLGIFGVLSTYYLLKIVREELIIAEQGAAVKSYASAGLAVISVGVVGVYNWLYDRANSASTLITQVFGAFAIALIAFAAVLDTGLPLAIPFFFFAGIYGAFVIAVFWSFATDVFTRKQGERLFPLVANGQTAGAVVGSAVVAAIGDSLSTGALLVAAAAVLVGCLGLLLYVAKLEPAEVVDSPEAGPEASGQDSTKAQEPEAKASLASLFKDRYILLISLLILMLNWVNSNGEFLIDLFLQEEAAEAAAAAGATDVQAFTKRFVRQWRAEFFTIVNICVLVIQAVVVSRFIRSFGVRVAVMALPVVALLGSITLIIVPTLLVIRITKTAENSLDYSLQNTAQQSLWLIVPRAAKYKAKAAVDTFVRRTGDVASAGVVAVGTSMALTAREFVWVNLGLGLAWLVVAWMLIKEHRIRTKEQGPTAPKAEGAL